MKPIALASYAQCPQHTDDDRPTDLSFCASWRSCCSRSLGHRYVLSAASFDLSYQINEHTSNDRSVQTATVAVIEIAPMMATVIGSCIAPIPDYDRGMKTQIVIVLWLTMLTSVSFGKTIKGLPFINDDFQTALARAKQRNLPLFVDVWAPW